MAPPRRREKPVSIGQRMNDTLRLLDSPDTVSGAAVALSGTHYQSNFPAAQVCKMVDNSITILERHYVRQKDSVLDAVAETDFAGWDQTAADYIPPRCRCNFTRESSVKRGEIRCHCRCNFGSRRCKSRCNPPWQKQRGNRDWLAATRCHTSPSDNKKPSGNTRGFRAIKAQNGP